METVLTVVMILFVLIAPYFLIRLSKKSKILKAVGMVTICYVVGLAISFIPIPFDKGLIQTIAFILIPLSIALILFGSKFDVAKGMIGKFILSFIILTCCVVVVSIGTFLIFRNVLPESQNLSAMISGLYTGGTPNLNGIGIATGTGLETIAIANLSDFIVGGVFLLFLLTAAKPVFSFVLDRKKKEPEFVPESQAQKETNIENLAKAGVTASTYDMTSIPKTSKGFLRLGLMFLLAVFSFAVGAGIAILFFGFDDNIMLAGGLISATTLGIAFSFFKKVRETEGMYQSGEYLIYVFSISIALSMDVTKIFSGMLPVLLFFFTAQFSVTFLHMLACRIFKIDADTAIITSVAGVYGPAFITPIANKLKNPNVVIPGLICGIIGYAIGTYLGLGMFLLLGLF